MTAQPDTTTIMTRSGRPAYLTENINTTPMSVEGTGLNQHWRTAAPIVKPVPTDVDVVTARALNELSEAIKWANDFGVPLALTEIGVRHTDPRWIELFDAYLTYARSAKVEVYPYGTDTYFDEPDVLWIYGMAAPIDGYRPRLNASSPTGDLVSTHLTKRHPKNLWGGVAMPYQSMSKRIWGGPNDGTIATNLNPKRNPNEWTEPTSQAFADLAANGVQRVRMSIWHEIAQPELGGPLSTSALAGYKRVYDAAKENGISVVWNLHNYGRYRNGGAISGGTQQPWEEFVLGTDKYRPSTLAHFWIMFATQMRDHSDGYELMNEPYSIPVPTWEQASSTCVDAIRCIDQVTTIYMPVADWSGVQSLPRYHSQPWWNPIHNDVRLTAHHYFDFYHTGRYPQSYDETIALIEGGGY